MTTEQTDLLQKRVKEIREPMSNFRKLVLRIYRAAKKRQTYISPESEWSLCREGNESDTDTVARIAEASKRDWLLHNSTGEALFFEGL